MDGWTLYNQEKYPSLQTVSCKPRFVCWQQTNRRTVTSSVYNEYFWSVLNSSKKGKKRNVLLGISKHFTILHVWFRGWFNFKGSIYLILLAQGAKGGLDVQSTLGARRGFLIRAQSRLVLHRRPEFTGGDPSIPQWTLNLLKVKICQYLEAETGITKNESLN